MNENIDTTDVNLNSEQYPQSFKVGDILDSMFTLYRNNYKLYLSIATIYFLAVLIEYSLKGFISGRIQEVVIPLIISMPVLIFALSAGVYITGSLYLDREISVDNIFKPVFHRFIPLIGSHLIVRLIVALCLISFSLSIVLTFRSGPVGILLGLIAIPFSIYLIVNWIFHIPVILFEKKQIGNSFSKSSALVKNSWWRVLGIIILILIISSAIDTILTLSVAFIMFILKFAGNTDYQNLLQWTFLNEVLDSNNLYFYSIMTFVDLLMQGLVFPIWCIGYSLLYIDRRLQVDGMFKITD